MASTTASSKQSRGTTVFATRQGELLGKQHAGYEAVLGYPRMPRRLWVLSGSGKEPVGWDGLRDGKLLTREHGTRSVPARRRGHGRLGDRKHRGWSCTPTRDWDNASHAAVLGLMMTNSGQSRADARRAVSSEVNPAPDATAVPRSGDRVLIRPIRPEDKAGLQEGLQHMTLESRYRRFFSPVRELSARQLRYLTEVDHHTHEALVAIDLDSADGIGVARFIRSTTDPTAAEAAVSVVDNWQGRGLGTALLHALAARARKEGVERFTVSVLAGNSPMLKLVRRLSDTAVIGAGSVAEVQVRLRSRGIPAALSDTMRLAARGEVEVHPRHPAAPS